MRFALFFRVVSSFQSSHFVSQVEPPGIADNVTIALQLGGSSSKVVAQLNAYRLLYMFLLGRNETAQLFGFKARLK